jgi:hypothetical protein
MRTRYTRTAVMTEIDRLVKNGIIKITGDKSFPTLEV